MLYILISLCTFLFLYIIVSERSSWEEVLLLKANFEMLTHCYQVTSGCGGRDASQDPTLLLGDDVATTRKQHCLSPLKSEEFGYSLLKDWNAMAMTELQRKFKQWEMKYLGQVHDILLPLVCRLVGDLGGNGRKPNHDVCAAISMLQVLYLASNIPTNPVYFNTDSVTSEQN